jgi:hypothetical protein
LEADRQTTVRDLFQKFANLLAHARDLVNEIDVINTTRYELIDLSEHNRKPSFAISISEEGLVAKGTGVRTAARELNLRTLFEMVRPVSGEDVMEMMMAFDRKIRVVECAEGLHIGHTKRCAMRKVPVSSRRQQPAIISQGVDASCGRV